MNAGSGVSIKQLGKTEDVSREPINVTSRHADEAVRLIGNLADTPFELDGLSYQSVESFWQGLKVADSEARRRIAMYPGARCKSDRSIPWYGATLEYNGATVVVGTGSWQLMQQACLAKFQQHVPARTALLATGQRPLVHKSDGTARSFRASSWRTSGWTFATDCHNRAIALVVWLP
jgi:hypothetical protein